MTKFFLDSGDPDEYKQIIDLAKKNGSEIWGATTNPSLIAKKLAGKKISSQEAFDLQEEIVTEILNLVPGSVSAEVYADQNTKAETMIVQGKEIASWNQRISVKLPTTLEGLKARTELRKKGISVNSTLVFSQEQAFAVFLHERILQNEFEIPSDPWPSFISPFVGRLDDINEDGMALIENCVKTKNAFGFSVWIIEASVRKLEHIKRGIAANVDTITAPLKTYQEWFLLSKEKQEKPDLNASAQNLTKNPYWQPPDELLTINSIDKFFEAIESGKLNIKHELTDKGIEKFVQDWKSIIA